RPRHHARRAARGRRRARRRRTERLVSTPMAADGRATRMHGTARATRAHEPAASDMLGVILLNLGGPDSLAAIEPFLRNLFADPDVIQFPPGVRLLQPLFARIVAQLRVPKTRANYELIGGRSPIGEESAAQATAVAEELERRGLRAHGVVAMGCWHPFSDEAVARLSELGIRRAVAVPLFPHYSRTTTGSSFIALDRAIAKAGGKLELT